ncbi:MAG: asparagine synthase (glutamine-hydrolyzing) [Chloroflexi bacterium]|nr:asparagine synthase (glutamine-hydrolyzing) [Chloroflexota bacterium]
MIDANQAVSPALIDQMRASIAHRGPDSGSTFTAQGRRFAVGLGAQRLSILDLSPAGSMPMPNEDESIWIAYNGEVYNHREIRAELERHGHRYRSRTDTETVLHAYEQYGLDCFALFNGIFACAIYDSRHERVILARDRTGVKPLYYVERTGQLACASELKALVQADLVPLEIDPTALEIYLALGYVPAPYTLLQGVRKLTSGTYAIYDGNRLRVERFWRPSLEPDPRPAPSWEETVEATRSAITSAVARQMMSDVPVGVMLSGGLDSSIVAATAQKVTSEPLHTFSIGFETHKSSLEPIYNLDRDYARQVAGELGTVHHEITATDSADLEDQLRQLVAQLDEPVWEPSFVSILLISTLAREHGVKVLLTGDGSDELFGGYPWHPALMRLEKIERIPGLAPLLAILARAPLPASLHAKLRDLGKRYQRSNTAKYHAQYDVFEAETRSRMVGRSRPQDPLDELVGPLFEGTASSPLAARLALTELVLWVGEHFNQRLDRMTMAASVEGRVPFQDNEVVQLALAMPFKNKLRNGVRKAPLRAAFADILPALVLERPKRPMAAPATAWMHGVLRPLVLQSLSSESVAQLLNVDHGIMQGIAARFREGIPVREEQIWTLLHLALWAEQLSTTTKSQDGYALASRPILGGMPGG